MKYTIVAFFASAMFLFAPVGAQILEAGVIAGARGLPFYMIKVVPGEQDEDGGPSAPADGSGANDFTGADVMGIPVHFASGKVSNPRQEQSDSIYNFAVNPTGDEATADCELGSGPPGVKTEWTELERLFSPNEPDYDTPPTYSNVSSIGTPFNFNSFPPSPNNNNDGGGGGEGDPPGPPVLVPEPATMVVFGIGALGLILGRRRKS